MLSIRWRTGMPRLHLMSRRVMALLIVCAIVAAMAIAPAWCVVSGLWW